MPAEKTVLITGATGALGHAVARAFLQSGARLALTYRDQSKLDELLQPLGGGDSILPLHADVTQETDVQQAVAQALERLGHIDILVNLVGGYWGGVPFAQTPLQEWRRMQDINLTSCFLCCRAVVPHMLERKSGRIINIAARAGTKGAARNAAYSAAKAGVIMLTECLAEEVKHDGITVNAILPSTIDTPANRQAMPKADFSRWVPPQDIANTILFLASEEARSITGAGIAVYGRA